MGFLLEECTFRIYDQDIKDTCCPFDCGNEDLNSFFNNDVLDYASTLLGKSYCFTLNTDPTIIIAAFTISNDSIKTTNLPNARKKKVVTEIPREKQMKNYPAVLIGRLGINKAFQKGKRNTQDENSVGGQLMGFIKAWFISDNKTGCRFILVDSYNNEKALVYYKNNDFTELFSTEQQEKDFFNIPAENNLTTRLLYFDLILLLQD